MRPKIFAYIAVFTILLIVFFFIPDILFKLRQLLISWAIFKPLISEEITNNEYIEIILVPLLNLFAITVSVLAFRTAKSAETSREMQKNTEIIKAAIYIRERIKRNMTVVSELKGNQGNIAELYKNEESLNYMLCLYGAQKITKEQFNFIQNFFNKIHNITNRHNLNDDKNKVKEINEFCDTYFQNDCLEYVTDLSNLTNLLDKIIQGESL